MAITNSLHPSHARGGYCLLTPSLGAFYGACALLRRAYNVTGIESSISTGEPREPAPRRLSRRSSLAVAGRARALRDVRRHARGRSALLRGVRAALRPLASALHRRRPLRSARSRRRAPSRARERPRASVNATLIAGIGTLLLAMGIGVLIGRLGHRLHEHQARGAGRDGRGRRQCGDGSWHHGRGSLAARERRAPAPPRRGPRRPRRARSPRRRRPRCLP